MKDIVDEIIALDEVLSLGTIKDSDIEKAETELSVCFAPEYKEYTSTFGAISYAGKEFTGAVQPLHLNVVAITKAARSITPAAKSDWYVVMDPHIDGIIFWQDGEGKIYRTEPNKEPKKVAESLVEYIKNE